MPTPLLVFSGCGLQHASGGQVEYGRSFTLEEVDTVAKVVLLRATVADNLFEGKDPLGRMVRIANVPFTIVGVLSKKGQNAGNGRDQDDVALLPLSTPQTPREGVRPQKV
jgi:putative ABC transport system permease protein